MNIAAIIILSVILVAEIFNIATYQYFRHLIGGRAKMTVIRRAGADKVMHYLCPGLFGRARSSFAFSYNELKGGITLVDYINTGMNPKKIAAQIMENAKENGYRAIIVALSIGSTIADQLDTEEVDVISISPCQNGLALRASKHLALIVLLPLANLVAFLLGWGAYINILSTAVPGERPYSVSLTLSMLNAATFFAAKDPDYQNIWSVILGQKDELLDNKWLSEEYDFLPPDRLVVTDAERHGDTIKEAPVYREAMAYATVNLY